MSLYKRPDSPHWWVDFTVNGQRVQRSTGTAGRKAAKQVLAKWQSEAWRREYLGVRDERKWEDAELRWLGETDHRASRPTDLVHLRWLQPHLKVATCARSTGITSITWSPSAGVRRRATRASTVVYRS